MSQNNFDIGAVDLNTGVVSTFAGKKLAFASGELVDLPKAPATEAVLNCPGRMVFSSGVLYMANFAAGAPYKVTYDKTSEIWTAQYFGIKGADTRSRVDAVGIDARFNMPSGMAIEGDGSVLVADTINKCIRRISPTGAVSTLPGVEVKKPIGIATSETTIYVSDANQYTSGIKAINVKSNVLVSIAGSADQGFKDGFGTGASFSTPSNIALGGKFLFVVDFATTPGSLSTSDSRV